MIIMTAASENKPQVVNTEQFTIRTLLQIAAERFLLLSSNMLSNADWGIALNAPDSLGRPSLCEKWIGSGSRWSKVPYSLTKSLC